MWLVKGKAEENSQGARLEMLLHAYRATGDSEVTRTDRNVKSGSYERFVQRMGRALSLNRAGSGLIPDYRSERPCAVRVHLRARRQDEI